MLGWSDWSFAADIWSLGHWSLWVWELKKLFESFFVICSWSQIWPVAPCSMDPFCSPHNLMVESPQKRCNSELFAKWPLDETSSTGRPQAEPGRLRLADMARLREASGNIKVMKQSFVTECSVTREILCCWRHKTRSLACELANVLPRLKWDVDTTPCATVDSDRFESHRWMTSSCGESASVLNIGHVSIELANHGGES